MSTFELKRGISVTATDYAGFIKDNRSHGKRKIVPIVVWTLVLLITILFYGALDDVYIKDKSMAFVVFLYVFIFVLITAAVWSAYFLFKLIEAVFYRLMYFRNFKFKNAEITINKVGVNIESGNCVSFALWDQIERISEGRSAFYLYYDRNAAFILPKQCIQSLEELAQLKELMKEMQKQNVVANYN